MPLENLEGPDKYVDDLNRLWPLGSDEKLDGDDHIRGIKNVVLNSFPTVAEARYPVSFILPPAGEDEEKAGAIEVSVGSDAQRPASVTNGALRWNTDQNALEQMKAGTWSPVDPTTKPAEMAASGAGGVLAAIDLSGSNKVAMGIAGAVGSYLPFARGEIDGFQVSQSAGNSWTMGAGVLIASDRKQTAELVSPMTKDLDLNWTEGDTGGGSFISGGIVADTSYHFCIIENDADGAIDWGVDTDPGGANTPTGWTFLRNVLSVKTQAASAALEPFAQRGSTVYFTEIEVQSISNVGTGTSTTLHVIDRIPDGVEVEVFGYIRASDTAPSANNGIYSSFVTTVSDQGDAAQFRIEVAGSGSSPTTVAAMFSGCLTNTQAQLALVRKNGGRDPLVSPCGYRLSRGRDA